MAKQQPPAFDIGDRVRFILGSPTLLVIGQGGETMAGVKPIICQWFSDDGHFHQAAIPPQFLVPETAGRTPPPPHPATPPTPPPRRRA